MHAGRPPPIPCEATVRSSSGGFAWGEGRQEQHRLCMARLRRRDRQACAPRPTRRAVRREGRGDARLLCGAFHDAFRSAHGRRCRRRAQPAPLVYGGREACVREGTTRRDEVGQVWTMWIRRAPGSRWPPGWAEAVATRRIGSHSARLSAICQARRHPCATGSGEAAHLSTISVVMRPP